MNKTDIDYNNVELNYNFFLWLFDTDRLIINSEEDPIPSTYEKKSCPDRIFYPNELKAFFETPPMQRLKRILQLGKFIDNDSNVLHTRYEHSLGVYNKKKNIIMDKYYNDPNFKNYIEKNSLKFFLIAELIKSAAHDIGHLPLSHLLEQTVIKKHGFHEDIGELILKKDESIQKTLLSISPELPHALNTVVSNDLFGFRLLDEGNYDIDRFDYLYRDLAYRGQPHNSCFEPFKLIRVKSHTLNGNTIPIENEDGSLVLTNFEDENNSMFIPVFGNDSIKAIEDFQNLRIKCYHESYFHPITNIRDSSVSLVINEVIERKEPYGKELQSFLTRLKSIKNANELDLDEFLYWNDLTFYNQLLNIAEFSKDKSLRAGARFVVPGLQQLFDMSAKMLGLKNRSKSLSDFDKSFLKRLHGYLTNKNDFTRVLSDTHYLEKCVLYTTDLSKISHLQKNRSLPVTYFSQELSGYNTNEPIYFETDNGKVFAYDKIPNRKLNLPTNPEHTNIAFCFLPFVDENLLKNSDFVSSFDVHTRYSFGTPYFNRPSPSPMYIEQAYSDEYEK